MDRLDNLIAKLTAFKQELFGVIEKAVRDNEEFITALNYEDQLYDKGIDRDGAELTPPYAKSTIKRKRRKGQITSHVTLRDENNFHRSFYIYYGTDNFQIMTSDPIENILTYRYGDEILGLTDENLQYVADNFIAPAIIEKMKDL